MLIYDFSPCFEDNRKDRPQRIALNANTIGQYYRAYNYCVAFYNARFPNNMDYTFNQAKAFYRKNAKILLSCCWNSITGKYELTITNKSIIKVNWKFWKYDFIGNLTDFALMYKTEEAA